MIKLGTQDKIFGEKGYYNKYTTDYNYINIFRKVNYL